MYDDVILPSGPLKHFGVSVCLSTGVPADLCLPGVPGGMCAGCCVPLLYSARDQKQDLYGHQPELCQNQQGSVG